ncbi:MAG TPA: aldehyde dehydrogenase family protein [Candidatus Binatia bacterium]|nr:aldehyde dehydrogenase family protein [Candidatus Binatia bacterium]
MSLRTKAGASGRATPKPLHIGHRIGGRTVESARTFSSLNPAHRDEVVAEVALGGSAEVDTAVRAARAALPDWRRTPWPARAEICLRASLILEERKEELARLMTREMGKVLTEARGDVQEAIDMGRFMAGAGRRAFGETIPSELRDKWNMTLRQPLGVVGCITPWNFPIAIPSWKIFPALVCGNTVVFKPSRDTPACAMAFVEVLEEAGTPPGVVNVVFGRGDDCGMALVNHPGVDAVSLTGSVDVGRQVAEACGRQLKKVSLELGGKNAIVVLADADLELAVDGAVWGGFGTTGQRCTATSRLVVERPVLDDFTEAFAARARALRLGDGLEEGVQVGPLVNQHQLETVDGYTKSGRAEGARLLVGGEVAAEGGLAEGFFYRPTIFTDVTPRMRIAQEEIFGPTVVVIPAEEMDQALGIANGTVYGLSLSVYTRDLARAFRAINELEAGIVYVNAPTIGAEIQLPFGGVKNTGNGNREAGSAALDEFSEWKSVYIDYSGRLQRAQIDTTRGAVPPVNPPR